MGPSPTATFSRVHFTGNVIKLTCLCEPVRTNTSLRASAHTGVAIPKIGGDCQEVNCPQGKRDHPGVRRLRLLAMTCFFYLNDIGAHTGVAISCDLRDCHVASLLAMTPITTSLRASPQAGAPQGGFSCPAGNSPPGNLLRFTGLPRRFAPRNDTYNHVIANQCAHWCGNLLRFAGLPRRLRPCPSFPPEGVKYIMLTKERKSSYDRMSL